LGAGGGNCVFGAADVAVAGWPKEFIKAERAAACAGVSCAWRERKPAQTVVAQTANRILETCILFFYANFPPDATAFAAYSFRQADGRGHASSE
jgi:hypothetical protein